MTGTHTQHIHTHNTQTLTSAFEYTGKVTTGTRFDDASPSSPPSSATAGRAVLTGRSPVGDVTLLPVDDVAVAPTGVTPPPPPPPVAAAAPDDDDARAAAAAAATDCPV